MTTLQRNLCIAIIALGALALGFCKAQGAPQPQTTGVHPMNATVLMVAMVYSLAYPSSDPMPVSVPFKGDAKACFASAKERISYDTGRTYREIWCIEMDPNGGKSASVMIPHPKAPR